MEHEHAAAIATCSRTLGMDKANTEHGKLNIEHRAQLVGQLRLPVPYLRVHRHGEVVPPRVFVAGHNVHSSLVHLHYRLPDFLGTCLKGGTGECIAI